MSRQVEVEQAPLVESEDEDEGEDEEEKGEGDDSVSNNGYSHSETSSNKPPLPRTYMLYEADEDDSDCSHDEQSAAPSYQKQPAGRYGGNPPHMSRGHTNHDNMGVPSRQVSFYRNGDSAKSMVERDDEYNLIEQAEVGRQSPSSSIQGTGSTSNYSRQQAGREWDSRTRSLFQRGVPPLKGKQNVDVSPEGTCVVEAHWRPTKSEPVPSADEPEGNIIWEMGEEEDGIEHEQEYEQGHISVQSDTRMNETTQQLKASPYGKDSEEDSILQISYESQRLDDLECAGWSQLTGKWGTTNTPPPPSPPQPSSSPVCKPDQVVRSGSRRLDQIDGYEDDEDDIACLEVGDLEM